MNFKLIRVPKFKIQLKFQLKCLLSCGIVVSFRQANLANNLKCGVIVHQIVDMTYIIDAKCMRQIIIHFCPLKMV